MPKKNKKPQNKRKRQKTVKRGQRGRFAKGTAPGPGLPKAPIPPSIYRFVARETIGPTTYAEACRMVAGIARGEHGAEHKDIISAFKAITHALGVKPDPEEEKKAGGQAGGLTLAELDALLTDEEQTAMLDMLERAQERRDSHGGER